MYTNVEKSMDGIGNHIFGKPMAVHPIVPWFFKWDLLSKDHHPYRHVAAAVRWLSSASIVWEAARFLGEVILRCQVKLSPKS